MGLAAFIRFPVIGYKRPLLIGGIWSPCRDFRCRPVQRRYLQRIAGGRYIAGSIACFHGKRIGCTRRQAGDRVAEGGAGNGRNQSVSAVYFVPGYADIIGCRIPCQRYAGRCKAGGSQIGWCGRSLRVGERIACRGGQRSACGRDVACPVVRLHGKRIGGSCL